MPDVASSPIRSWTIPSLGDITSDALGKGVVLEVSNTLRGESGANQEEEGGRADQEPVERSGRSSLVDQPSYFGSAEDLTVAEVAYSPTMPPQRRPTTTGIGIDEAGRLSET